jgi:hypothetical protein
VQLPVAVCVAALAAMLQHDLCRFMDYLLYIIMHYIQETVSVSFMRICDIYICAQQHTTH